MIRHKKSQAVLAHQVEIFDRPEQRALGLLKFAQAPTDYAAVFNLPFFGVLPLVHTFGMKFPIDIVFCDSSKRVSFISRAVPKGKLVMPWKFLLGGCRYLVEFSQAPTDQLAVGDELEWAA